MLFTIPRSYPSTSTAGMPAYTETQMYLLPAATVHVLQPLLTAATVCYVIECYQTSFACNVLAICLDGNLI